MKRILIRIILVVALLVLFALSYFELVPFKLNSLVRAAIGAGFTVGIVNIILKRRNK